MAKLFAPLVFFLLMGCELKNDLYPKEGITFPNQAQWQIDAYHKRINEFKQNPCLLYTSPSPRDRQKSRMPSSA